MQVSSIAYAFGSPVNLLCVIYNHTAGIIKFAYKFCIVFFHCRGLLIASMLDATLVHKVMKSTVKDGIIMAFLMNSEGEVITSALLDEPDAQEHFGSIAAAVGNAWRVYARCDLSVNVHNQEEPDSLEQILLELSNTKICAMSVAGTWVAAVVSNETVEIGMLKLKAASLQRALDHLLQPVLVNGE